VDIAPGELKKEKELYTVRVQAQGGKLEKSVTIQQDTPVTAAQTLEALDRLESQLSRGELGQRDELKHCSERANSPGAQR
jgi:hypothetical protein